MLHAAIPSQCDSPVVFQPRKQPFNMPPVFVAAQRSAILRLAPTFPIRCDHFDPVFAEPAIKSITVVSAISNESFWQFGKKTFFESTLDKGDFIRRSTR